MPRLGQTMEHGTVLHQRVVAGATFVEGETLYVVETEKVEIDVEAKSSGRLVRWLVAEGDEREVGAPLAVFTSDATVVNPDDIDEFLVSTNSGQVITSTSTSTPVVGNSTAGAPAPPSRLRVLPKARALAQQHGIDLHQLAARVGDRPITVQDVQSLLPHTEPDAEPDAVAGPPATGRVEHLVGLRRTMARRMTTSWSEIPHFVQTDLVDMSAVIRHREHLRVEGQRPPTITAYLARALVVACHEVPLLSARVEHDTVHFHDEVRLNIAVDTPHGLVTPVLHHLSTEDLFEISSRLDDLVIRAREQRLGLPDMTGGTVTLSNLGAHGADLGSPVIQPGQTALLFAGRLAPRAVVVDGDVVACDTVWLSLACDHRVLDGATAARALETIRNVLIEPSAWSG